MWTLLSAVCFWQPSQQQKKPSSVFKAHLFARVSGRIKTNVSRVALEISAGIFSSAAASCFRSDELWFRIQICIVAWFLSGPLFITSQLIVLMTDKDQLNELSFVLQAEVEPKTLSRSNQDVMSK